MSFCDAHRGGTGGTMNDLAAINGHAGYCITLCDAHERATGWKIIQPPLTVMLATECYFVTHIEEQLVEQ